MNHRWTLVALLTLLGGCSDWPVQSRYAAASNAAAFIRAARSNDQATFDSYIDWPAVRSDIQAQLAQAHGTKGAVLLAAAEPGRIEVDQIVRTSNFHFKAAPGSFGGMLGAAHLALMVRPAGEGRLCLPEGFWAKSCVLTFAPEAAGWKVVGMSLELLRGDDAPVSSI
jgi:hypothetical protein